MLKFVVLFLLLSYKIFAVEIDVKLTACDTNYTLGDKILLQYKVEHDNNLRLIVPDFSSISPHFECLENYFDSTSKILFVTLISFEAGNFELPAVPFLFEDISSKRLFTHLSPAHKLPINSIKIKSNQLEEAEFKMLPERQWNLWVIAGAIVAALVCGMIIKIRMKK